MKLTNSLGIRNKILFLGYNTDTTRLINELEVQCHLHIKSSKPEKIFWPEIWYDKTTFTPYQTDKNSIDITLMDHNIILQQGKHQFGDDHQMIINTPHQDTKVHQTVDKQPADNLAAHSNKESTPMLKSHTTLCERPPQTTILTINLLPSYIMNSHGRDPDSTYMLWSRSDQYVVIMETYTQSCL